MSLEEQATIAQSKLGEIQELMRKLGEIIDLILSTRMIEDETFEYTAEQKQKLIQKYQTVKLRLKQKVEELP